MANHPYQTPEIIELPIQQGHKSYLEWIKTSTKGEKKRRRGQEEGEGMGAVECTCKRLRLLIQCLFVSFCLRCCCGPRRSVGALIATHIYPAHSHRITHVRHQCCASGALCVRRQLGKAAPVAIASSCAELRPSVLHCSRNHLIYASNLLFKRQSTHALQARFEFEGSSRSEPRCEFEEKT